MPQTRGGKIGKETEPVSLVRASFLIQVRVKDRIKNKDRCFCSIANQISIYDKIWVETWAKTWTAKTFACRDGWYNSYPELIFNFMRGK